MNVFSVSGRWQYCNLWLYIGMNVFLKHLSLTDNNIHSISFSIMVKCWALDPEDRPTFETLSTTLEKLLQMEDCSLELNMVLLPPGNAYEDESGE